ncbi:hypothetical protein ENBRE01_1182 [Enteropsectra breve]|nr:hypothetical protein ENBRE01_1182 [Enteropsectra breve]
MKCQLRGTCVWYLIQLIHAACIDATAQNEAVPNPPKKTHIVKTIIDGLKINIISHQSLKKTFFSVEANTGLVDSPSECPGLTHFFAKQLANRGPADKTPYFNHLVASANESEFEPLFSNDFTKWSFSCKSEYFKKFLDAFVAGYRPSELYKLYFENSEKNNRTAKENFFAARETFKIAKRNFYAPKESLNAAKENFDNSFRNQLDQCNTKFLTSILLPCISKEESPLYAYFPGSRESLKYLDCKKLLALQDDFYSRNNTTITLITPLSADEAKGLLKESFSYLLAPKNGKIKENSAKLDYSNISDMIKDQYKNRIVLFRNRKYSDENLMDKVIFILIPLPKAGRSDHKAVYDFMKQIIDEFMVQNLNYILQKLGYAYGVACDIATSTKTCSFLRIEVVPTEKGHCSPEDIGFLLETFFKEFITMAKKDIINLSPTVSSAYYEQLRSALSEILCPKQSLKNGKLIFSDKHSGLIKHIERNLDNEWLIDRSKKTPNMIECIKNSLKDVFSFIENSKNWIIFTNSAAKELIAQPDIHSNFSLGFREKNEVSPDSKDAIQKNVEDNINFYFNDNLMKFEFKKATRKQKRVLNTIKAIRAEFIKIISANFKVSVDDNLTTAGDDTFLIQVQTLDNSLNVYYHLHSHLAFSYKFYKKSAIKKSANIKSTNKKSPNKKSTNKKSTIKKSPNKKSTNKKSTNKKSTIKKSTIKKSANKKSANKKSVNKKSNKLQKDGHCNSSRENSSLVFTFSFMKQATTEEKMNSLFALYIAFYRLQRLLHIIPSGCNLRTDIMFNFDMAIVTFQGLDEQISNYSEQFVGFLENLSLQEQKHEHEQEEELIDEAELAYARQLFINVLAKVHYTNHKISDMYSHIFISQQPLPENEAQLLAAIKEVTTESIILSPKIKLALNIENISQVNTMHTIFEKCKGLAYLDETEKECIVSQKLSSLIKGKKHEIKYEHSLCNSVLHVIPFDKKHFELAALFHRFFKKAFLLQYMKHQDMGNLGCFEICEDANNGAYFILGAQGRMDILDIQSKLKCFWIFCNRMLEQKQDMHEMLELYVAVEINNTCGEELATDLGKDSKYCSDKIQERNQYLHKMLEIVSIEEKNNTLANIYDIPKISDNLIQQFKEFITSKLKHLNSTFINSEASY